MRALSDITVVLWRERPAGVYIAPGAWSRLSSWPRLGCSAYCSQAAQRFRHTVGVSEGVLTSQLSGR